MPSSKVTFRTLKESDLTELEDCFPQPAPGTHRARLTKQRRGHYSYLGALINRKITAILLIRWQGSNTPTHRTLSSYPEIGSLYVLPEYRRQGLASRLLEYGEAKIIEQGYGGVGLVIKEQNAISMRLHLARGYKSVGKAQSAKSAPNEPRSYYTKSLSRKGRAS